MILTDRDANTAWAKLEAQDAAASTLEERVDDVQIWRASQVALTTSDGRLINQVRDDPYGVPVGIAKSDLEADGDVDNDDYTLFSSDWSGSTMPFADWNWDGTKNSTDITAYLNDKNADTGLGRAVLAYLTWSHAGAADRKGYAGYEVDPVLTGSEGWASIYHVRNRVYLSQLGRWTRRDPLGYRYGAGLHCYSADLAMVMTDPTGQYHGDAGDIGACPRLVLIRGDQGDCGGGGGLDNTLALDPTCIDPTDCVPCCLTACLNQHAHTYGVVACCDKTPTICVGEQAFPRQSVPFVGRHNKARDLA
ncbi:MAG: hypothetical protein IPJ41_15215 [Phycisphaerales bacterium]|nr:hypothetical protein [Phycisphaerales bacterium]